MCLLEEVVSWDAHRILCRAVSHRSPGNPLRSRGRLAAVCGVEYAAQAAAVHGALLQRRLSLQQAHLGLPAASDFERLGLLASARAVELAIDQLDGIGSDLLVHAERVHADAHGALYAFAIDSAEPTGRRLLHGRLTVLLDATTARPITSPGTSS